MSDAGDEDLDDDLGDLDELDDLPSDDGQAERTAELARLVMAELPEPVDRDEHRRRTIERALHEGLLRPRPDDDGS